MWLNEEPDPINGTWKCTAPDQEPDEQDVGEGGREEDHLARGFDRFPDAKVDNDPSQYKESEKFPTNASEIFNV